jgi:hypothetical protein
LDSRPTLAELSQLISTDALCADPIAVVSDGLRKLKKLRG